MGQSYNKDHTRDKAAWYPDLVLSQIIYLWASGRRNIEILAGKKNIALKCRDEELSPCQGQINSVAGTDCALCCTCDLHQVNQYKNMTKILIFGNELIVFANKSVSAFIKIFVMIFRIQE